MMKNIYRILTIAVFSAVLAVFMLAHIILPDKKISESERRSLAAFPEFSAKSVLSGKFAENLEKYLADQFPGREGFRFIASASELIRGRADVNGIYSSNGFLSKLDTEFGADSVRANMRKLGYAVSALSDGESSGYFALIPPKEYYFGENMHPRYDFDALGETCRNASALGSIELTDVLELESYYASDSHWRQEKIVPVCERVVRGMGFDYAPPSFGTVNVGLFRGVYAGQSGVWLAEEELSYLDWNGSDSVEVTSLEGNADKLYTLDKYKTSIDKYDIFLGGAVSFLTVENQNAVNDAHIVLIRDSFGSSLTPLLASQFRKITAVDLRYISLEYAKKYLAEDEAPDAVLVILSPGIVKTGGSLKIKETE